MNDIKSLDHHRNIFNKFTTNKNIFEEFYEKKTKTKPIIEICCQFRYYYYYN